MVNCQELHKRFPEEIDYKDFKAIISLGNKKIIQRVIEKGQTFDFGHHIGSLKVLEVDNEIRTSKKSGMAYTRPLWPESLKRKQEIINRGGTPLEGDNGGEPWMVFNMNDKRYKYYWNRYRRRKGDRVVFPLKRIRRFHFKLTKKNCKDLNRFAHNNHVRYDSSGSIK